MSDVRSRVEALQEEASDMEYGDPKVSVLEEALRLADPLNDDELLYSIHRDLIDASVFSGHHERMLVSFAWCLAQHDRDPQRFGSDLLWQYKWVLGNVSGFPNVSRERIESMFQDFETRAIKEGGGKSAQYSLRRKLAIHCGDIDSARRWHAEWKKTPPDFLSDCRACVCDSEVRYYAFVGEDERALKTADPILNGRMRCAEVPHITFACVFLPLFRMKELKLATEYHRRGVKMIKSNRTFLDEAAEHIWFLVLTENLQPAVRVYQKFAYAAGKNAIKFHTATLALFTALKQKKREKMRMRLPRAVPIYQESGAYSVSAVLDWAGPYTENLAKKFDARNGNTYFASRVAEARTLWENATPYALDAEESSS